MDSRVREATRLWTLAVPTVSAFIISLVRDFQDRDDVLQETAVAVMESFARYDPAQSFVGWAIGIARNQVWLYFRRKGRDRQVLRGPPDPQILHLSTQLRQPALGQAAIRDDHRGAGLLTARPGSQRQSRHPIRRARGGFRRGQRV